MEGQTREGVSYMTGKKWPTRPPRGIANRQYPCWSELATSRAQATVDKFRGSRNRRIHRYTTRDEWRGGECHANEGAGGSARVGQRGKGAGDPGENVPGTLRTFVRGLVFVECKRVRFS
jgi:hypothetical protein